MTRPRMLDLFCGAGGCAVGYHRAGFDVTGVDIASQPNYPFAFVRAEALEYLAGHGGEYDAIHASPPCQGYSRMSRTGAGKDSPKLIPELRSMLWRAGKPFVIENVEGSDLEPPCLLLCGTMLGLRVRRHRLFEVRPPVLFLTPDCTCKNGVVTGRLVGQMLSGKTAPGRRPRFGYKESDRREAIGVPWMTTIEARQAIPPAYTEYVGLRLLEVLG